jgi:hypothetical protein
MGWWSSDDPRRRAAFVAVALVASAVLGLGAGAVIAMAGDDGATDVTVSGPTASPSPSASPSERATAHASSEIEPGATRDVGYFLEGRREDDGTHVTFDRVLLLTGKAAHDYAKAHHKKKPSKDEVLLVNDNDLTRDLVLSPDVKVLGASQLIGSLSPKPVPLRTLLDALPTHGAGLLLDLTYDDLGYVTQVREHVSP